MREVTTDERGRITIPKDVRERLGERYRLVELRDGLKLLPVPSDPVQALRAAASDDLRAASLADLTTAADRAGREGAEEQVR